MGIRQIPQLAALMAAHFHMVPDKQMEQINAFQQASMQGLTSEQRIMATRADAATPYSARDQLTQTLQKTFRSLYARETAKENFSTNTELMPGMLSWRARRIQESGEPTQIGDGGQTNDTNSVSISEDYQDFDIIYWGLDVKSTFMEDLANNAVPMAVRSRSEKLRVASDAHKRKHNSLAYSGLNGTKLYGFLQNPWVPRMYVDQAIGFGESIADMQRLISLVLTANVEEIKGWDMLLSPIILGLSPRMSAVFQQSRYTDGSGQTLSGFILAETKIIEIREIPELQNAGGDGIDAIIAFNDSVPDTFELMEVIEFLALPQIQSSYSSKIPTVSAFGGMKIAEPLSGIIAMVPYTRPPA